MKRLQEKIGVVRTRIRHHHVLVVLVAMLIIASALTKVFPRGVSRADFTNTTNATAWSVNGAVYTVTSDATTTYVGGDFQAVGHVVGSFVPIDTASGTHSSSFPKITGTTLAGIIYTIISDGSGGWYAGGEFTQVNGVARKHLVRIASDGTIDPTFNPVIDSGGIFSLALGGGTLYAGGYFTTVDGGTTRNRVAAFNATTGAVTAFDPNIDGTVVTLLLDGTTLYVGGPFTTVNGGTTRNGLAAFNTATGTATAFDINMGVPGDTAYALFLDGTTLYVGGSFTTVNGGTTRNGVAAFDTATSIATAFNPNVNNTVFALFLDGTTLYVGGSFTTVNGGTTRNRLAAFNTATGTATAFDSNIDGGDVRALTLNGTTLYVGGSFTTVNGGTTRNRLAAFSTATGIATTFDPSLDDTVYALLLDGTTLYTGGKFLLIDSINRNSFFALDRNTDTVTSLNLDANGEINSLVIDGTTLYVGGGFSTLKGGLVLRNYLASFDVTTGIATAFNPNMGNTVYALALDGSTLYAGGGFTEVNAGSVFRNYLAAFNTATGTATAFDPNASSTVYALAVSPTAVFVGGDFATVNGGTPRNLLAAVDKSTGLILSGFDAGMGAGTVSALVLDGSTLYAGGTFATVNSGTTRNNLAAFETTGGVVSAFDPNMNGDVQALAIDGQTLYVGGAFTTVNSGTTRNHFVALDTTSSLATAFNPSFGGDIADISVTPTALYLGGSFLTLNGALAINVALFTAPAASTPTPTPTLPSAVVFPPAVTIPPTSTSPIPSPSPTPPSTPSPSVSVTPSPTATSTPRASGSPRPTTPTVSLSVSPTVRPPVPSVPPRHEERREERGRAFRSIVATTVSLVTAIATLPLIAESIVSLLSVGGNASFGFFMSQSFLEVVGIKKKSRVWGTIYDAKTKRPIPYARIQLKDAQQRVLETRSADDQGRYGFLTNTHGVSMGDLSMTMTPVMPGYAFPSTIVTTDPDYFVYDRIYKGTSFTIRQNEFVNFNIPLDPVAVVTAPVQTHDSLLPARRFASSILDIAFWMGVIIVPFNAIVHPSLFSIGFLVLFFGANGVRILGNFWRPFGRILDESGKPIPFALVIAQNAQQSRVAFTVSDERGRYFLLVPKNEYQLSVHTPANISPARTSLTELKSTTGWITKDLKV